MAKREDISADLVRQLLDYDPETGVFTYKARKPEQFKGGEHSAIHTCNKWNSRCAGSVAGSVAGRGHIDIAINRVNYRAHRLAWLYVYGKWPENGVDHIDGNPANNRLSNLRDATQAQNMRNAKKYRTNATGEKNVGFDKRRGLYHLSFTIDGTQRHFAYYETLEEARRDRDVVGPAVFGEWWRNG